MLKAIGVAALVLTASAAANAQPLRGFVGAGFGSATFGAVSITGESPSTTFTNATTPGRLVGFIADAGFSIGRRFGLGVEFWQPGRHPITQDYLYLFGPPYRRLTSFRERTIFGVVRGRINERGRVTGAAVAGGGLVRQDALERFATVPPFSDFGPVQHTTVKQTGFVVGAEVEITTVRWLSVVPEVRVVIVPRNDSLGSSAAFDNLGLNTTSTRFGLTVRVGR